MAKQDLIEEINKAEKNLNERIKNERIKIDKQYLLDFETEIKELYETGKISSPIHLSGGNEEQIIEIFKEIKDEDWVFSTWRSHYHTLLKSRDPEWLKNEILEDRSIHVNSSKYRIFSSAIVGGILPIALGTALAIKRKNLEEHVWCFVGDMAAETGMFHECAKYAGGQDFPITFVIEDNGFSVYTPTKKVWKKGKANIRRHKYKRIYPHYGIGKWVDF